MNFEANDTIKTEFKVKSWYGPLLFFLLLIIELILLVYVGINKMETIKTRYSTEDTSTKRF